MMEEHLYNYFSGTMTEVEKDSLFREMEKDAALKEEFAALQNAMAVSGLLEKEGDDRMTTIKLKELKQKASRRKNLRISWRVMKYAAIIFLLVGTWFLSQEHTLDTYREEYTWVEAPKGQRVFITLADGTGVWLNPCTKLKVPNVFDKNQRVVELEGEGFFKVTKNPNAPFTVKTRQYNVQVLGTEFNVFAYPDSKDFETELVKGSVYVYHKEHSGQGIYLHPNEKVLAVDGHLRKVVSPYRQQQLQSDGIFMFGDKPFGELLKRLELWYGVKFIVKRPEILNQVYTGKFRQSDDIGSILQAIKDVGKFDYHILSEKEIAIF